MVLRSLEVGSVDMTHEKFVLVGNLKHNYEREGVGCMGYFRYPEEFIASRFPLRSKESPVFIKCRFAYYNYSQRLLTHRSLVSV
jgi:hypothetical protein